VYGRSGWRASWTRSNAVAGCFPVDLVSSAI
jgi:hypothetical protein